MTDLEQYTTFTDPREKIIESAGLPSILQLKELAKESDRRDIELGVQILKRKSDGEFISIHALGTKTPRGSYEILEPKIYSGTRADDIQAGVFFHTHPGSAYDLSIFPSQYINTAGEHGGDTKAHISSREFGGYWSVLSRFGITLPIAVVEIGRSEQVDRYLRMALGNQQAANELMWKIYTGKNAGQSFPDLHTFNFDQSKAGSQSPEDVVLASFTYHMGTQVFFLHVSWNQLLRLENVYGGTQGLCFGSGIPSLVKALNLDQIRADGHEPLQCSLSISAAVKKVFFSKYYDYKGLER